VKEVYASKAFVIVNLDSLEATVQLHSARKTAIIMVSVSMENVFVISATKAKLAMKSIAMITAVVMDIVLKINVTVIKAGSELLVKRALVQMIVLQMEFA
jgi:hypothetical protein